MVPSRTLRSRISAISASLVLFLIALWMIDPQSVFAGYGGRRPSVMLPQLPTVPPQFRQLPDTLYAPIDQQTDLLITTTDSSGLPLTITAESLPANASWQDHHYGSAALRIRPTRDQVGTIVVTLIVANTYLADTAFLPIVICAPGGEAPVWNALPDTIHLESGDTVTLDLQATDPDGTIPELKAYGLPAHCTFTVLGGGRAQMVFMPSLSQNGNFTVTFSASDGHNITLAHICLSVVSIWNRPPVWHDVPALLEVVAEFDTSIVVYATDYEGMTPVLSAYDLPPNATFTDWNDGTAVFTFAPPHSQVGTYDVYLVAADTSAADTAKMVVRALPPINRPPYWIDTENVPDTLRVASGTQASVTLMATDPDSTVLALTAEGLPQSAAFTDNGNNTGLLTFSPLIGQTVDATVLLICSDGGAADSLTLVLIALPPNPTPDSLAGFDYTTELVASHAPGGMIDQVRTDDIDADGLDEVLYRVTTSDNSTHLEIWDPQDDQVAALPPVGENTKAFSLRPGDGKLDPVVWTASNRVLALNSSGTAWDSILTLPPAANQFQWAPDNPYGATVCYLQGTLYSTVTEFFDCEYHNHGRFTDTWLMGPDDEPVKWPTVGNAFSNPDAPSNVRQLFSGAELKAILLPTVVFDQTQKSGYCMPTEETRSEYSLRALIQGAAEPEVAMTYFAYWWYDYMGVHAEVSRFAIGLDQWNKGESAAISLACVNEVWAEYYMQLNNEWTLTTLTYDGAWHRDDHSFFLQEPLARGGIVTTGDTVGERMLVATSSGHGYLYSIPDASLIGRVFLSKSGSFSTAFVRDSNSRDLIFNRSTSIEIERVKPLSEVKPPPVTIHVPGDVPTIQGAINIADHGDTVLVAPGTYVENIDFLGRRLRIIGEAGPAQTTLQGAATGTVVRITTGEGAGTLLSGLTIVGNSQGNVIEISNGASPVIIGNVIRGSTGRGYAVECNSEGIAIMRNVFVGNEGAGCLHVSSGSLDFRNNTCDGYDRGIHDAQGLAVIRNNIIANCTTYGIFRNEHSNPDAYAFRDYNDLWNNNPDYYGGVIPGKHDISLNPQFTDPANGDYTLAINSPCVDNGDPGAEFTDADGTVADIGAFALDASYFPRPASLNLGPETRARVISHAPVFYWSFADADGLTQQQFQIQVGTDNEWTAAEMWDSGAIVSGDTSVVYAGAPLTDGDLYWYRVRVRDENKWGDWPASFFRMNNEPSAPAARFPGNGTIVSPSSVSLLVGNATDTDADSLDYEFEIYSDPALTQLVQSQSDVPEVTDTTRSGVFDPMQVNQTYWWRARAFDGYEYSLWSDAVQFMTSAGLVIRVPEDQPTIQEGINASGPGDTVVVAPGAYTENIDFAGKSVIVKSSAGPHETVIQAADSSVAVVSFVSGEPHGATLWGFTITGGRQSGIRAIESSPTIRGNEIHGNAAIKYPVDGGGIDLDASTGSMIEDNIIHDNQGRSYGGAIHMHSCRNDTIRHNVMYANTGVGDIRCLSTDAVIANNTISVTTYGGIVLQNSNPYEGTLRVTNNIIFFAPEYAIRVAQGTIIASYNCTFANNRDYSGMSPGTGSITSAAQFVDSAAHDYRLQYGSPCIDAGDPDPQYIDPDGSRSDIGAIPFTGPGLATDRNGDGVFDLLDVVEATENYELGTTAVEDVSALIQSLYGDRPGAVAVQRAPR